MDASVCDGRPILRKWLPKIWPKNSIIMLDYVALAHINILCDAEFMPIFSLLMIINHQYGEEHEADKHEEKMV
jgi:hypothetical protein